MSNAVIRRRKIIAHTASNATATTTHAAGHMTRTGRTTKIDARPAGRPIATTATLPKFSRKPAPAKSVVASAPAGVTDKHYLDLTKKPTK